MGHIQPGQALSARERQVVHLLSQGHRRLEIADILGIAPGTVQNHLLRIFMKLETGTAGGAVGEAYRRGELSVENEKSTGA